MSRTLALRLTATAEEDVGEIWSYLALEASESFATEFLGRLEAQWRRLQSRPLIGPTREMLAPGLRVLLYSSYGAYYLVRSDDVMIVRVLHGARDLAAIAAEGGFGLGADVETS